MAYNFVLPDLGEGIAEGEIRKWLVKVGDTVEEHQPVLEIETDKAVSEVPSPRGGTVLRIGKEEGTTAKVGEVLLVIGEAGEKPDAESAAVPKPAPVERKSVSVVGELPEEEEVVKPALAARPKSAPPVSSSQSPSGIRAMPAVRAFAKEQGVALETIKGTGPDNSITLDDVKKAATKPIAKSASALSGEVERIPFKGLRKRIAQNLIATQRTTAFVTETDQADITELWDLRQREKKALQDKGIRLTFLPFIMKAIQHTVMDHPLFNASLDDEHEELIVKKFLNIGVAVDTDEGLIVPVVKNVEKKTIREIAQELETLSKQTRERSVKLENLKGSSFSITNYGTFGAEFATPIINYPDVAILGTGKITDKPWVRNGQIVIRKILPLSLTFDHRVNDGAAAAKFLARLVGYLEDPASIFIESA
jgi:pyruvate dehydrogenase E2 component (dihydrolipoamide acetyltransferase)